jgi:predicted dehydrogenase
MNKIRWGIIGLGSIAANFAQGLSESESGELFAVASRSSERCRSFGNRFGVQESNRYTSYEALCADPDVDAIHIATPHPFHAQQALMAIRSGKHISVEKPMSLNAEEATVIVEAARRQGVFFMEAYMYLHHPQIKRLVEILREGTLGQVQHIRAVFGFFAPFDPDSRLYNYELAGGGILDVGGYAISAARMIAGISDGDFSEPVSVRGVGKLGQTGVDEVSYGLLQFENGITAEIACAVAKDMEQVIEITCENGSIRLDNPWVPGRDEGPSDSTLVVTRDGISKSFEIVEPRMLFALEAEAASHAIQNGRTALDFPAMTPEGSIGNARVQDIWRREVGYVAFNELPDSAHHH